MRFSNMSNARCFAVSRQAVEAEGQTDCSQLTFGTVFARRQAHTSRRSCPASRNYTRDAARVSSKTNQVAVQKLPLHPYDLYLRGGGGE